MFRTRTVALVVGALGVGLVFAPGSAIGATIQQVFITNDAAHPVPVAGAVSVNNLPSTQAVTGSVNVGNLPATQPISGAVSVSNLPATQAVSGTVSAVPVAPTRPFHWSGPLDSVAADDVDHDVFISSITAVNNTTGAIHASLESRTLCDGPNGPPGITPYFRVRKIWEFFVVGPDDSVHLEYPTPIDIVNPSSGCGPDHFIRSELVLGPSGGYGTLVGFR